MRSFWRTGPLLLVVAWAATGCGQSGPGTVPPPVADFATNADVCLHIEKMH